MKSAAILQDPPIKGSIMVITISLIGMFLTIIMGTVLTYRLSPSIPQQLQATTYPRPVRVLEIRYIFNAADIPYQPDTLSSQLQTALNTGSRFHVYQNASAQPSINVQVVQVINRSGGRPNPTGSWYDSAAAILAQDNVCQQISDLNIDEVWIWVDPRAGHDTAPGVEYAISSNYFQNGVQYATIASPAFCSGARGFALFGFDYSRTYDLALHSWSHYMEGMLGNIQTVELFWYRYNGDDTAGFTRSLRCGNVHFPPNTASAYDYSNASTVTNACQDWNPDSTGATSSVNCSIWGCSQGGYLDWWLENMPNMNNTLTYQGKTLPNWFDFSSDLDATLIAAQGDTSHFYDTNFLSVNNVPLPTTTVPVTTTVPPTTVPVTTIPPTTVPVTTIAPTTVTPTATATATPSATATTTASPTVTTTATPTATATATPSPTSIPTTIEGTQLPVGNSYIPGVYDKDISMPPSETAVAQGKNGSGTPTPSTTNGGRNIAIPIVITGIAVTGIGGAGWMVWKRKGKM